MPSVRFQLFREGVQDAELRLSIIRAYLMLPEEQRKPYRALLDELPGRVGASMFLGQNELALDLPAYRARLQVAAAELAGVKSEARWEQPPNE